MQATTDRPKITVTADGRGVASHAGTRLLADLATVTGLTDAFSEALGGLRRRCAGHSPGRVAFDLALLMADGGVAISDLAVLRDQGALFGPVASTSTAWRVLDGIDEVGLAALRRARAVARERLWLQREETCGPLPDWVAGAAKTRQMWSSVTMDLSPARSFDPQVVDPSTRKGRYCHLETRVVR